MRFRWVFPVLAVALLAAGIKAESRAREVPAIPPPRDLLTVRARGLPRPGQGFTTDVSRALPGMRDLRVEERREQRADWAVHTTLLRAGLDASALRVASFDRVPMRRPELEEVMGYEYGPARRVVVSDEVVWIFYEEGDPRWRASVAREADHVRMESGVIPRRYLVFSHATDVERGELRVVRRDDIDGGSMFRADGGFGYVERLVHDRAELEDFVRAIDDLTFAKVESGAVRLGGRRIEGARTPGVTLDDVSALAFAQRSIAGAQARLRSELEAAAARVIDPFNEMVRAVNSRSGLGYDNLGLGTTGFRVDSSYAAARARLLEALRAAGESYTDFDIDRGAEIEALRPRVQRAAESLGQARLRVLRETRASELASEPGFSLDPLWDVAGLRADLATLLSDPAALAAAARSAIATIDPLQVSREGAPAPITTALGVSQSDMPSISDDLRARIAALRDGLRAEGANDDAAIVAFAQLVADVQGRSSRSDPSLLRYLRYIEARRRIQCARYDGPLQGTEVGMVLFYTDLMAKIWASVDYDHATPLDEVPGFLSEPGLAPSIFRDYEEEIERLNSTRIWFGPRQDRYTRPDESTVVFSPIATRVFSAGANNLRPGDESTPSESSRRVFGWWDRHFARVADYEPMYHRQNEIMKWSVVTGIVTRAGVLSDVGAQPPRRDWQFDRWVQANPSLRYRGRGTVLLPESRWLRHTECLDRLMSRNFDRRLEMSRDRLGVFARAIEGGVSLGSFRTLEGLATIRPAVSVAMRRAGINFATSSEGMVESLRRVSFRLDAPVTLGRARVGVEIAEPTEVLMTRVRSGPLDASFRRLSSEIHGGTAARSTLFAEMPSGRQSLGAVEESWRGDQASLSWQAGALDADRSIYRAIGSSSENGLTSVGRANRGLFGTPEVAFDSHTYVIESGRGLEVVRIPEAQGFGARVIAPRALEGDVQGFVTVRRGASDIVVRERPSQLVGQVMTPEAARLRLRQQPWQRLRVADGRVERAFTATGPQGGVRVRLETGDPALPEINAMREGDALYLERPTGNAGEAARAFDDLVTRREVSGGWVERSLRDVANDRLVLPPASPERVAARESLTRDSVGDFAARLDDAARRGRLEAFVDASASVVDDVYADALLQGRRSEVARWVEEAVRGGRSADDMLRDATFAAIHDGPEAAVAAAQRVPRRAGVDPSAVARAEAILAREGRPEVGRYLRARLSGPENLAHGVSLEASGNRLRVALNVDRASLRARRLTPDEIRSVERDLRSGTPLDVYVEENAVTARLDMDAAPGDSVARLRQDPNYVFEHISVDDTGSIADVLISGGRRYSRRTSPVAEQYVATAHERVGSSTNLPRGLLIRRQDPCDADGDGAVDGSERARCASR